MHIIFGCCQEATCHETCHSRLWTVHMLYIREKHNLLASCPNRRAFHSYPRQCTYLNRHMERVPQPRSNPIMPASVLTVGIVEVDTSGKLNSELASQVIDWLDGENEGTHSHHLKLPDEDIS